MIKADNKIKTNNKGFSLIELIVVIAILAVLIGVLAPTIISNIEKSRRSKCISDRDSLRTQINIGVVSGDYPDEEAAFNAISDSTLEHTCKSGGEYTFKWVNEDLHTYQIACSDHDDDEDGDLSLNIDKIIDVINSNRGGTTILDSTCAAVSDECTVYKVINALKDSGFNLGNMNATTWKYYNSGKENFFYWSPESLDKYNVGDTLPVIRYNVTTGTYTVWKTQVCYGSNETAKQPYKQFGNNLSYFWAYTPSTGQAGGASVQTYENAMERYKQYVKEMNK